MRRRIWLAVALSPALLAMQCFRIIDVRVEPEAMVGEPPAFHFAMGREPLNIVQSFSVTDCRNRRDTVWHFVRDGVTPMDPRPLRVTYGQVPPGYDERHPAVPLQPGGCYHASVTAVEDTVGGPTPLMPFGGESLHLLPNGRLIVGSPGGLGTNSRPFRHLNRAAVGCARGYRRARSRADSLAVNAREFHVLDQRLSCEWLYANWPHLMSDPIATEQGLLAGTSLVLLSAGIYLLGEILPDPPE